MEAFRKLLLALYVLLGCYFSKAQDAPFVQLLQYEKDISNERRIPLVPIQEYEIVNPIILDLLDTAMYYTESCIYHILGKPYYYIIGLFQDPDTVVIYTESKQYTELDLINLLLSGCSNIGFFFMNKSLVIFLSHSGVNHELFFKKTNNSLYAITYPHDNICVKPWFGKICESFFARYIYTENKLNKVSETSCGTLNYILRTVRDGDTYERLAEQCRCPVETLHYIDENYFDLPIKEGDRVIVRYELINGKVNINRISHKTLLIEQEKQAQNLGLIPIKKTKRIKKCK